MSLIRILILNRKLVIAFTLPFILLPLLLINVEESIIDGGNYNWNSSASTTTATTNPSANNEEDKRLKCAYVILLIAIYWMTEALPLAVTSFIPIVLFPFFGILDTSKICASYMKEASMMMIGGMVIATALEFSNLHLRIALKVMTKFGGSPSKLLFGVMITSCVLSMWMSNTATIAVMGPIVLAFVDEMETMEKDLKILNKKLSEEIPMKSALDEMDERASSSGSSVQLEPSSTTKSESHLRSKKMYLLAICYASKLGATGTITATGSNLIFQQVINSVDISQGGKYLGMNFSTWMAYNIPGVFINVIITWIYLTIIYLGFSIKLNSIFPKCCFNSKGKRKGKDSKADAADEILESQDKNHQLETMKLLKYKYSQLGRINFHEGAVGLLFIILIVLWITRDPGYMSGWASLISPSVKIGDASVAMLIVLLLFLIPKNIPDIINGKEKGRALLEWSPVLHKIPWGTVLLVGAGFSLSEASSASGLSAWIGDGMSGLEGIEPWVLLILVTSTITMATEIISNTVCANLFLPILITMSERLNLHPLYLTIPATLSCNYAFMLPSASATSSIVYAIGQGDLTIMDMVKHGIFLNITCVIVSFALNSTYGSWLFDYNGYEYPIQ